MVDTFIGISEYAYREFRKLDYRWAGKHTGRSGYMHDIHSSWLEKAREAGLVDSYTIRSGNIASIQFIKRSKRAWFKPLKKTLMANGRGVKICYYPAERDLHMQGVNGWGFDLGIIMEAGLLSEYLAFMGECNEIQQKIDDHIRGLGRDE